MMNWEKGEWGIYGGKGEDPFPNRIGFAMLLLFSVGIGFYPCSNRQREEKTYGSGSSCHYDAIITIIFFFLKKKALVITKWLTVWFRATHGVLQSNNGVS